MAEIPRHWKEWTRLTLVKLKPDLTLADLSYMIGEAVTEDLSCGATEVLIKIEKDRIVHACNKGDLHVPTGYDPKKLYSSLFKDE